MLNYVTFLLINLFLTRFNYQIHSINFSFHFIYQLFPFASNIFIFIFNIILFFVNFDLIINTTHFPSFTSLINLTYRIIQFLPFCSLICIQFTYRLLMILPTFRLIINLRLISLISLFFQN